MWQTATKSKKEITGILGRGEREGFGRRMGKNRHLSIRNCYFLLILSSNLKVFYLPVFFTFTSFFLNIITFFWQGRHVDSVTSKSRYNINLFTLNKLNFHFSLFLLPSRSFVSHGEHSLYKVNNAKDDWIINPIT